MLLVLGVSCVCGLEGGVALGELLLLLPVAKLHVRPSLCMNGVGLLFARCSESILLIWSSGIRPILSGVDDSLARLSPPKPRALNLAAIAGAGFLRILKVAGEVKDLFSADEGSMGEVWSEWRELPGEVSEGGAAWTDNSADDAWRRRSGSMADPMVMVAASAPNSRRAHDARTRKQRCALWAVLYGHMSWRCREWCFEPAKMIVQ